MAAGFTGSMLLPAAIGYVAKGATVRACHFGLPISAFLLLIVQIYFCLPRKSDKRLPYDGWTWAFNPEGADLVLDLAPETGGSVASFRRAGPSGLVNLMRPMSEEARVSRNPGGASMFPMVPFANRMPATALISTDGHIHSSQMFLGNRLPSMEQAGSPEVDRNAASADLGRVESRSSNLWRTLILIRHSNAFVCRPIV